MHRLIVGLAPVACSKQEESKPACEADPAFRAGLNAAMAGYPMMRRSD